jgi:nucleoid-associated protein YgaU
MTSDAKIGLLLGLVFIFVIAFIINGLPGLHHKDDGNKLTTNMVGLQNSQSGLGANERKVVLEPAPSGLPAGGDTQSTEGAAGSTDARFTMAIPQGTPTAADSAPAQPSGDGIAVAPVESTPAVSVEPATPTPAQNVPAGTVQPTAKPQTTKPAAPKFYGEKEGNKMANINAIFEANRKTLASIDELQVGQKLVIPPAVSLSNPPLAGSSVPAPTAGGVLSGPGFTKVDSIGQRHLTTSPDKPAPTAKSGNVYVVQEGDSLWRIAAQRLGDGNRFKDIVKLNGGVLSNEDDLQVGMQLKMPAR